MRQTGKVCLILLFLASSASAQDNLPEYRRMVNDMYDDYRLAVYQTFENNLTTAESASEEALERQQYIVRHSFNRTPTQGDDP